MGGLVHHADRDWCEHDAGGEQSVKFGHSVIPSGDDLRRLRKRGDDQRAKQESRENQAG